MQKKAPENSTAAVNKDPMSFLEMASVMGSSNAIETQEAHGQQSFIGSDTLPTEMTSDARKTLEKAGVKFLGTVPGDEIFQYVTLPKGWRKEATDHSMWSKLVDEKGKERASIFYKAAFYDRRSHLQMTG